MSAPTPELLSSSDVARLFGVSAKTVARWARRRQLAHIVTPGGHRRFYRADVDAFLKRKET